MPQCYPEQPEFAEDRHAERAVWEALRDQLPDDAALFHSVGLLEGDRERELDLLVAWPGVGIAVVEVKGGHVTRDGQGWYQESKGQKRKIGSPVVQAQDGKNMPDPLPGRTRPACRAASAHLVAFPYTAVPQDWHAVDCPRSAVIDSHDLVRSAALVAAAVRGARARAPPLTPWLDVSTRSVVRCRARPRCCPRRRRTSSASTA